MPRAIQPAPEFVLCHGDHAVTLRASLRAAVALEQFPGGFQGLFHKLSYRNLPAFHAVIRASATDLQQAERLIAHTANHPLAPFLGPAQAACLALLSVFLHADQGEAPLPPSTLPKPLCDHLADLYRFGTGWLGWPPSEVWNASPAELEAAFLAHVDRLVQMTPGAEAPKQTTTSDAQRQANIAAGLDPEFDRAGLRALKQRHGA